MQNEAEMPRVFLRGFSNQNPSPLQDPLHRRNDSKSLIFNFLNKNTNSVDVEKEKKPHSQSQESPNNKTVLRSPSFTQDEPEKKAAEHDTKFSEPAKDDTAASRKDETPIYNTKMTPEHNTSREKTLLSGFEKADSIQDLGEDNCTSSIRIEVIPKKAREIGTVREVHEGPMSESAIVDPKLEKKIERIVEQKVKQRVEEIVEKMVDRRVETLITEQNHAPIQSIESIEDSSNRQTTLLLQKKALDKAAKLRYNEESRSTSNISVQTSLKQSSIKGNTRNRFWDIDQKHGKISAKNTFQSSAAPKNRQSGTSNVSESRSRKPSLPPLNQSRKGTSRGGDSSLVLQADQNQSIETVPAGQDYSFLSYNLQETDVRFVLNEFSEFSRVNKILEDNLRRQEKVTKRHKKEKSIPISKLYDKYIPENGRTIVHQEIRQLYTIPSKIPPPRQSNSSPYLSEVRPRIKKSPVPRGYYMPPIVRGASNKMRSQPDMYDGNSSDGENSGHVSMFVGGDYNKSRDSRNSLDRKSSATEAFNKFYNADYDTKKTSLSKAPRASNLLNKASQKRMNNSDIQPSTGLLGARRRSSNKLLLPKPTQSVITEVSDTDIRSSHKRKGSRLSSQGSQKKLTISRSSSRELIDSNQLLRAHYRIQPNLERKDSERSLSHKANNKSVHESPDKAYLGEKNDTIKWISTLEKQAFSFARSKRPFIGKEIEYPGPNKYDLSTYKTMTNKKHLDVANLSPNSMAKNKLTKPPSKTDLREGILNLDVTSQKFSKIQKRLNNGSEIGSPFTGQSQKNSAFSSLHASPIKRPNKDSREIKAFTIDQVQPHQIPTVIVTKTSPEQKPIEKVQDIEQQPKQTDL